MSHWLAAGLPRTRVRASQLNAVVTWEGRALAKKESREHAPICSLRLLCGCPTVCPFLSCAWLAHHECA
eukprot:14392189-Alexandrium_andersonii.AAC.1